MKALLWVKHLAEYLGGCRDEPPPGCRLGLDSPLWVFFWGLFALVVFLFCGQTSKFIYIDF